MTHETASEIHEAIKASAQAAPRMDLYRLAVHYADIRANWRLSSPEERRRMNSTRTATHDALIDATNILRRQMAAHGEDVSWFGEMGSDRKEIGDLACYLACFLGIAAR